MSRETVVFAILLFLSAPAFAQSSIPDGIEYLTPRGAVLKTKDGKISGYCINDSGSPFYCEGVITKKQQNGINATINGFDISLMKK